MVRHLPLLKIMSRILIIDDDEAMRAVLREHLSSTYEVIDTGLPETALAMTIEHKPDAILLDLSMTVLSGFELCRKISSLRITQRIPIFIVSGQDERNASFCRSLGASGYFTKPVDFAKLKAKLAWVLELQKTERRANARIQVRVLLKLKGIRKDGTSFEVRVDTDNMSNGGFLCACASSLEDIANAEVFLCDDGEHRLGRARPVRVEKTETFDFRYAFQFIAPRATADIQALLYFDESH